MKQIKVPTIITANTYFWTSSASASGRRYSEEKKHNEVREFLLACGLEEFNGYFTNHQGLHVSFSYSESCKNVYKKFAVVRNQKNSNIRGLAAELKKQGIELIF